MKPIREISIKVNTFISTHKAAKKFYEYEIFVRSIHANEKLFLKIWGTLTFCSSIKQQNIYLALKEIEFVKDLISSNNLEKAAVTGRLIRVKWSVTIKTISDWCLSRPFAKKLKESEFSRDSSRIPSSSWK